MTILLPHSELFEKATSSEFGVAISLPSKNEAMKLRRKLYSYATNNRPIKERGISILLRGSNLLLVKRDRITKKSDIKILGISNLLETDLPRIIRARGPSKFSFHRIT